MADEDSTDSEAKELASADARKKVAAWLTRIKRDERKFKDKWYKRADKVIDLYRDEEAEIQTYNPTGNRFNILYSNVETLKPALYSQTPTPDVRRRFRDRDDVGRQVSEMMERVLTFSVDSYDFDGEMQSTVEDVLLPGRGLGRVKYKAITGPRQRMKPAQPTGMQTGPNGLLQNTYAEGVQMHPQHGPVTVEEYEGKVFEEVSYECWPWKDVVYDPSGRWEELPYLAFKSRMTKTQLRDDFGDDIAAQVKLTDTKADKSSDIREPEAEIYEVWDKEDKKVYTISPGYEAGFLYKLDDEAKDNEPPFTLEKFYPCPQALYAIQTNGTLMPVPEYTIYQDLANELNDITDRLAVLTKEIKASGMYNAVNEEMKRLKDASDGELVPITGLPSDRAMADMIVWFPIETIANVIVVLEQRRESIKQNIYEITGISDIVRGASDPNETLGAQKLKGQFSNIRLSRRQRAVQYYVRDIFRIKGEIIGELFDKETLQMISGMPVTDQMMQVIRADNPRIFRIDIESDSTIAADMEAEKQQLIEMVGAVTQFAESAPTLAAMTGPKFVSELLLLIFRRFKIGRSIEETLEQSAQEAQQPKPPPPPSPQEQAAQAQMQADQQKSQIDMQKSQMDMQAKQQSMQMDMQMETLKAQNAQQKAQLDQQKVQYDADKARMQAMLDAGKNQSDAELMQLEVAIKREELLIKQEELQLKRASLQMQNQNQGVNNGNIG